MTALPLANLAHHKLRSALSILGIALAVCMLITLSGLSRGSLGEIADRWESIDADLIAYPSAWGDNISTLSGVALSDRYADRLRSRGGHDVVGVVPVFLWQVKLAGQDQMLVGVDSKDLPTLAGAAPLVAGRAFDPDNKFADWLAGRLLGGSDQAGEPAELNLANAPHDGLEIVLDARLAAAGGYHVGDRLNFAGQDWTMVGIVRSGGLARVYVPRRTAQFLFAVGDVSRSTLMFVKLAKGVDEEAAMASLSVPGLRITPLSQYRRMLTQRFASMYEYVDVVNFTTLAVAFLFIMVVLYTMVLQRRREIAILKSCGASPAFLLRQILGESLLLTAAGLVVGIAGSFAAAAGIEHARPLLTVKLQPAWMLVAAAAAATGAAMAAIYPAWAATRVDMASTLTME